MKINKKLLGFGTLTLPVVVVASMFFAMNPNTGLFNRVQADDEVLDGSISFARSTGTVTTRSNEYNFLTGTTTRGTSDFYLYNASRVSLQGNSYCAILSSSYESGDCSSEISFSTNISTSPTLYKFQYISSITLKTNTSSNRTLNVLTSEDGTSFTQFDTVVVNSSGGTINLNGARYVKFTLSTNTTTYFNNITVNFRCSYNGEGWIPGGGDDPEEKTLESIAVKTAPTKTTYTEGDHFEPAGLVITATYDDTSTEDIAYSDHSGDFTFTPNTSTALSTTDTSITIGYGGKTCSQAITVSEGEKEVLSGSFIYTYNSSTYYELDFDNSRYHRHWVSNDYNFTFTLSNVTENSFTLVRGTGSLSDFGSYRPFNGSASTNTTGVIISATEIQLTVYDYSGKAQTISFTK